MKAVIVNTPVFQAGWLCCVLAGHKPGAVDIADFAIAMTALAIGWAVFTPVLLWLSECLNGFRPGPSQTNPAGWSLRV